MDKVFVVFHVLDDHEYSDRTCDIDVFKNIDDARKKVAEWHSSFKDRVESSHPSLFKEALDIDDDYEDEADSYSIFIDNYYIYDDATITEKEVIE